MESLKARHAAGDNKSPYAEPLHIVFGKVGKLPPITAKSLEQPTVGSQKFSLF